METVEPITDSLVFIEIEWHRVETKPVDMDTTRHDSQLDTPVMELLTVLFQTPSTSLCKHAPNQRDDLEGRSRAKMAVEVPTCDFRASRVIYRRPREGSGTTPSFRACRSKEFG